MEAKEYVSFQFIYRKKQSVLLQLICQLLGVKTSNDLYKKYLDEIGEIVQKFNYCDIIFVGDMNASLVRHKATTRDKIFINGIEEIGFCLPKNYPIDNTFHHNNGGSE